MLETLYDIFSAPNVEPLESTRMGLPAHFRGHKCSTCVCLDHAPLVHLSFVETAHLCKARSPGRTQYYNLLFDSSCHSVDSLYLVILELVVAILPRLVGLQLALQGGPVVLLYMLQRSQTYSHLACPTQIQFKSISNSGTRYKTNSRILMLICVQSLLLQPST